MHYLLRILRIKSQWMSCGWPRNVAARTYPSSRKNFVQVPRHTPVIVGRGPGLLPHHTVYILLWNKEVLQHIEVDVTRNGCLGRKNGPETCCAYGTESIHLRTVSHMFDNLVGFCDPHVNRLWLLIFPDK